MFLYSEMVLVINFHLKKFLKVDILLVTPGYPSLPGGNQVDGLPPD
mgnify:CR=1 FL=1